MVKHKILTDKYLLSRGFTKEQLSFGKYMRSHFDQYGNSKEEFGCQKKQESL